MSRRIQVQIYQDDAFSAILRTNLLLLGGTLLEVGPDVVIAGLRMIPTGGGAIPGAIVTIVGTGITAFGILALAEAGGFTNFTGINRR